MVVLSEGRDKEKKKKYWAKKRKIYGKERKNDAKKEYMEKK